ncbi:unnamed protein product [Oikopleura dioica]|uniref:ribonuclease H n=1 Tax=Oikopleura dioica TaxID=34765 RepID=E4XG45_OIKDI|nr:unnamed protein product [Oikopleura dioica]
MPFVERYDRLWVDENDYLRDRRGWFICYTDGSCKGNHQRGIRFSGSGVHFGYRKEIIRPCHTYNPRVSTNQHAELKAALLAIRHAEKYNLDRLQIRTDSQFLIDMIPHRSYGGNMVSHLAEIVDEISYLMNYVDVEFVHVPAHRNENGNDRADYLAKRAADIHRERSLQ